MGLGRKGLPKKAKKLELRGLGKYKFTLACLPGLDELLNDVYIIRRPKPFHYHHRRDLIHIFNEIAREVYGNSDDSPIVEGFGSFVMDMFGVGSDLDLSVNFSSHEVEFPREKKIQALRKFVKKFYSLQRRGHVAGIQIITSARVPIVKVIDQGTGIQCDISVENRDGIVRSQIIRIISAIDARFQKLSFLMKAWAKAHGINSSKDQTLNSLSIVSLVAFHLQTRDPPILPPFAALFKDGTDPPTVTKIVQNYLNYGTQNKESLSELFVTLLVKLASIEKLWHKGLCASVYEASWIYKSRNSQFGTMTIEDFTNRSQNVARAVGKQGIRKIYKFIHQSLQYILAFLDGQIEGPKLKNHLFGMDTLTQRDRIDKNIYKNTPNRPTHQDSHRAKKMRLTDWEGTQVAKFREGTKFATNWGEAQLASELAGAKIANKWGKTKHAEGLGAKQCVKIWGKAQCAEGWGGTWLMKQQEFGEGWRVTKRTKECGGIEHANGWGRWQQANGCGENFQANGWVGKHQVNGWGKTRRSRWRGHELAKP